MTDKEKQELYENICNDISCGTYILAPQYVDKLLAELEKENAELERDFRICENNADTYYDKLQKAKQIIQEFLELNYSEFTKTNAVFLHADKFLKE